MEIISECLSIICFNIISSFSINEIAPKGYLFKRTMTAPTMKTRAVTIEAPIVQIKMITIPITSLIKFITKLQILAPSLHSTCEIAVTMSITAVMTRSVPMCYHEFIACVNPHFI